MFKLIEFFLANAPSITLDICRTEELVDVIFRSFRIFQADSVASGACKLIDLFDHVLVA
jgi:hypothetical protein